MTPRFHPVGCCWSRARPEAAAPRPRRRPAAARPARARPRRPRPAQRRARPRPATRSAAPARRAAGRPAPRRPSRPARPAGRHRRRRGRRPRGPGRPHRTHRGRASRPDLPGGAELRAGRAGHADRAGRAPVGAARGRARRVSPRARTARGGYRCTECGHQAAQWVGRCPSCQAWGSLEQTAPVVAAGPRTRIAAGAPSAPARRIGDVALDTARARPTGVSELDRVLGGGLIPGSVVLLAGEPGVGKSTLLLAVAAQAAAARPGAVRHRRGVRGPGAAARRAHRGRARGAVPGRRVRPGRRASGTSRRWTRSCWSSTRCRRCPLRTPTARRAG